MVERRLKRQKKVMQETIVPEGLTYLEARSVRQSTIVDYSKRFAEFQGWLKVHQIWIDSSLAMGTALIELLQEMSDIGRGINDGIRLVAAVKFHVPHFCTQLPRSSRSLRGWHLAAPPQQRMPIPIEVLMAAIGRLLNLNAVEFALRFQHT